MKDFDLWDIEYMASRFNPLATGIDFLDQRYEWQAKENGVEWPYYRFFYHLAGLLRPRLTIELGGWQGTAAAHLAMGWRYGYVITIDHHTDPGDDVNEIKMLEAVKHCSNLYYLQGWSSNKLAAMEKGRHARGDAPSVYPQVLQYLKFADKIDILFIDSWHVYEYAKMDWDSYKPLLNSPALVICDDIRKEDKPGLPVSGMMRFWEEMPDPKFLNSNMNIGTQMGFVYVE